MWNSRPVIDESEMCSPFLQEFINLTGGRVVGKCWWFCCCKYVISKTINSIERVCVYDLVVVILSVGPMILHGLQSNFWYFLFDGNCGFPSILNLFSPSWIFQRAQIFISKKRVFSFN